MSQDFLVKEFCCRCKFFISLLNDYVQLFIFLKDFVKSRIQNVVIYRGSSFDIRKSDYFDETVDNIII